MKKNSIMFFKTVIQINLMLTQGTKPKQDSYLVKKIYLEEQKLLSLNKVRRSEAIAVFWNMYVIVPPKPTHQTRALRGRTP